MYLVYAPVTIVTRDTELPSEALEMHCVVHMRLAVFFGDHGQLRPACVEMTPEPHYQVTGVWPVASPRSHPVSRVMPGGPVATRDNET